VIEGFLDILLPLKKSPQDQQPKPKSAPTPDTPYSEFWRTAQCLKDKKLEQKLLFTVKPGGIAGYLGQLRNSLEGGIY
jgi:lysophospholipid hydrolase